MRPRMLLLGGGLILAGLLLLTPPPRRAAAWRAAGRAGEHVGWWAWRGGLTAHDRYAEIMMDEAERAR